MLRLLARSSVLIIQFVLIILAVAVAQPLGVENADVVNSSRYNESITPRSVNAQAGNVSELSISTTAVTRTWQGFYGNITGSLVLADSSGNNFYDWNVSAPSGQVYASRNDSVSWTGIECLNQTRITEEEAYLGTASSDPDSVTNTFSSTTHPNFFLGTQEISSCPSTQAYGSGETQDGAFWQVLLDDEFNNTVYTSIIEDTSTLGFNDRPWDFQLLVGENGEPGNDAPTPYYFYVELN